MRAFKRIPIAAPALILGMVAACSEADPNAAAISSYLKTVVAQDGWKIADVKSPDDILTGLVLGVRGESGCRAAHDPNLKAFAHQIVFGALDGWERANDPAARPFKNESIWGKDASKTAWDEACATMRETRERYLDCALAEDTVFLLGVFTLDHYEGREATHADSYDAARDLMRVGTREHEAPKAACETS